MSTITTTTTPTKLSTNDVVEIAGNVAFVAGGTALAGFFVCMVVGTVMIFPPIVLAPLFVHDR